MQEQHDSTRTVARFTETCRAAVAQCERLDRAAKALPAHDDELRTVARRAVTNALACLRLLDAFAAGQREDAERRRERAG